jgi:hypothetical protein
MSLTINNEEADRFDMDLFRLKERAFGMSKSTGSKALSDKWLEVELQLRIARSLVRSMMTEKQREATS